MVKSLSLSRRSATFMVFLVLSSASGCDRATTDGAASAAPTVQIPKGPLGRATALGDLLGLVGEALDAEEESVATNRFAAAQMVAKAIGVELPARPAKGGDWDAWMAPLEASLKEKAGPEALAHFKLGLLARRAITVCAANEQAPKDSKLSSACYIARETTKLHIHTKNFPLASPAHVVGDLLRRDDGSVKSVDIQAAMQQFAKSIGDQ